MERLILVEHPLQFLYHGGLLPETLRLHDADDDAGREPEGAEDEGAGVEVEPHVEDYEEAEKREEEVEDKVPPAPPARLTKKWAMTLMFNAINAVRAPKFTNLVMVSRAETRATASVTTPTKTVALKGVRYVGWTLERKPEAGSMPSRLTE